MRLLFNDVNGWLRFSIITFGNFGIFGNCFDLVR